MYRQILVFILSIIFLATCASANPVAETEGKTVSSQELTLAEHNLLEAEWMAKNVSDYSVTAVYNVFGPSGGTWKVTFSGGVPVEWEIKNRKNNPGDKTAAEMFSQGNLFKLAASAYTEKTEAAPYLIEAEYSTDGYVISVARKKNPDFKNPKPADTGFRIVIKEINYQ